MGQKGEIADLSGDPVQAIRFYRAALRPKKGSGPSWISLRCD
jgi:hypothetical protein